MRSGRTPPFVRPDRRAFEISNWRQSDGRELQDGDLLEQWDQSLLLEVARFVEIDLATVVASARLSKGTKLAMIPTWWSYGTGLRGRGEPIQFALDPYMPRQHFDLLLSIPGNNLGGQLQLRSALVLIEPAQGANDPLAAHRCGSVLWEDSISIVLEGLAPRYPITAVDFVDANLGPENACWHFELDSTDLSLPAMAAIRLYVNSRQKLFHAAITTTDRANPAFVAIRSTLKFGVGLEMVHHALEKASELETGHNDFPPGSSGRVLLDLIERLFPGRGPIGCREDRKSDPGQFHAAIQAKLALFGEEYPK